MTDMKAIRIETHQIKIANKYYDFISKKLISEETRETLSTSYEDTVKIALRLKKKFKNEEVIIKTYCY